MKKLRHLLFIAVVLAAFFGLVMLSMVLKRELEQSNRVVSRLIFDDLVKQSEQRFRDMADMMDGISAGVEMVPDEQNREDIKSRMSVLCPGRTGLKAAGLMFRKPAPGTVSGDSSCVYDLHTLWQADSASVPAGTPARRDLSGFLAGRHDRVYVDSRQLFKESDTTGLFLLQGTDPTGRDRAFIFFFLDPEAFLPAARIGSANVLSLDRSLFMERFGQAVFLAGKGAAPDTTFDSAYAVSLDAASKSSFYLMQSLIFQENESSELSGLVLFAGTAALLLISILYFVLIRYSREVERKVQLRTSELNIINRQLRNMSMTDGLTGIANRRKFDKTLDYEWRRCTRTGTALTLVMMDIDFFKNYNDEYGHVAGDNCLMDVAQALAGVISRAGDLLARYGGEEFALILPDTGLSAIRVAHMCREAVESMMIPHAKSRASRVVTISVGVSTLRPSRDTNPEVLIRKADSALYQAKNEGRNRVIQADL